MKTFDEYYKEWSGEDHTINSNKQVHDSAEMTDFAEYCYKQKSEPLTAILQKILSVEDAAFGLKGFDVKRLKSEIREALQDEDVCTCELPIIRGYEPYCLKCNKPINNKEDKK